MKVLHNQSVLDFVLHRTGSVSATIDFCFLTNISLTDDLIVGADMPIGTSLQTDLEILKYYTDNNFIPATAIGLNTINTDYGIGEMRIESTFIVR